MNADTTVLEASLGWAIAKSRREGGGFPGAETYLRQAREGVRKKLHGLVGEERPRSGTIHRWWMQVARTSEW